MSQGLDSIIKYFSGALKTDFTRTGQRTKLGALEDGRRSAIRYFKNNFADGFRQVRGYLANKIFLILIYRFRFKILFNLSAPREIGRLTSPLAYCNI